MGDISPGWSQTGDITVHSQHLKPQGHQGALSLTYLMNPTDLPVGPSAQTHALQLKLCSNSLNFISNSSRK